MSAFDTSGPGGKLKVVPAAPLAKATAASDVDSVTAQVGKVQIDVKPDHLKSGKNFEDLQLPPYCLKALTDDFKYQEATQIQAEAIPYILQGRNLRAQAPTGSGKSIAFMVGMLNSINTRENTLQAICIAPTSVLAYQIQRDVGDSLSKYMTPACQVELAVKADKKVDMTDSQFRKENDKKGKKSTAHMIIGTAGTISAWVKAKYIDLRTVKIFVIDEADKMIAETAESRGRNGTDAKTIRKLLPNHIQSLFFSATYTPDVIELAEKMLGMDPVQISIETSTELINDKAIFQTALTCPPEEKVVMLSKILEEFDLVQTIIFCETRDSCDEVAKRVIKEGFTATVIHSKVDNQQARFEAFRRNEIKVLIATDILARGVDVRTVKIIVNYDVPRKWNDRRSCWSEEADTENYLHRIGRCSRHGESGTAISLISTNIDRTVMDQIERFYETKITTFEERTFDALVAKHNLIQAGSTIEEALGVDEEALDKKDDGKSWA